MQITTIHYERKTSDGAYGNRSLAATASVDEGEDVALAMGQLILLVRGRLAQDEAEEQEEQARRREEEMARYRAEQERRRQEYAATGLERREMTGAEDEDLDDEEADDDEEEPQRGRALPF